MSDSRATAEGRGGVRPHDYQRAKNSLGQPSAYSKVQRFFRKLSDDQVQEFVAVLDKQLAATGNDPTALRQAMIRWVASQP